MESRALLLSFVALVAAGGVLGCGRKASPTITADPSGKGVPSTSPPEREAAAVYAVVLQDHLSPFVHKGTERIGVIDATSGPPCGTTAKLASSLPTARADTLDAWTRLSTEQPLEPFSTPLSIELVPLSDAIALLSGKGGVLAKAWPAVGLVRFTSIAFDGTQTDALVGLEHWATPVSREAFVIHLVRREAIWFEQEILRCP